MSGHFDDGVGSRVCRRWVRWYTRDLPDGIGVARRDEVASDLWEHAHDGDEAGRSAWRHDLAVIGRVLSGVPADLTWRQGILRSHPRPVRGDPMTSSRSANLVFVSTILLAAIGIMGGFGALILLAQAIAKDEVTGLGLLWSTLCVGLAGCLVAGIVLRDRHPGPSTAFLVVGAPAIALTWFWLPPAYLLTIILVVVAFVGRPGRGSAPAAS